MPSNINQPYGLGYRLSYNPRDISGGKKSNVSDLKSLRGTVTKVLNTPTPDRFFRNNQRGY